jgi:inorganic pyrophosphatase
MKLHTAFFALFGGLLAACAAGGRPAPSSGLAAEARWIDAQTIQGERNYLAGWEPKSADGWVRAVIEIPAGRLDKWEVKEDGLLHWDVEDGRPRVVRYLGYPANYGMVPRTVLSEARGGDGDPLDVLVLGASLPRGSVVDVKVIGMILLVDRGEGDDKLLAVAKGTPFEEVEDVDELQRKFPGVTQILQTWFLNYKGPGKFTAQGFAGRDEAVAALERAIADFAEAHAAAR